MDVKKIAVIAVILSFSLNAYAAEFDNVEGRSWTYQSVAGQIYDETPDTQARRGTLPIGIPSFNRRVKLPRVQEGKEGTGLNLSNLLRLHPAFSEIFDYTDNIFLSHNKKQSDVAFKELPALTAELQNSNLRMAGGYGMEIVNFADHHKEDAVNHFAHGFMEYDFTDLKVSVEDTLSKEQSRLSNANSIRDDVTANAVQVLTKYDQPRWAVEPGWTHNTVNHASSSLRDYSYDEDVLSLLTGYKVTEKTMVLLENDFGFTYYHRKTMNADQKYWQILTGVRGEYIENLLTEIKGGFQARRPDNISAQVDQKDYNGFVADGNVSYKLSDRDAVSFDYIRTANNSTFVNNSYFLMDRLAFSYSKRFFEKWILTPEIALQYNRYPNTASISADTAHRRDHFWQSGLELRYQATEWLSGGVAYRFLARQSNMDNFDYSNNHFVCDLSFAY